MGKSDGGAAPLGGGTASWEISLPLPELEMLKTCMTSPLPPGRSGRVVPLLVEFFSPETYARLPFGSIAMPPEAPGSGSVCTTFDDLTETIFTSLSPAPPETVQ